MKQNAHIFFFGLQSVSSKVRSAHILKYIR